MKTLGIYVHIPYCRSKCPYCDFFSLADTGSAQAYVQAVNDKLINFTNEHNRKVDTLYIGGGTPSVLEGKQVASIIQSAKKARGSALCEITVECNPSDIHGDFLETIYAAGANRLSFGLQSAVDSERRALGRRADAKQVEQAVRKAQQIGFKNISLDLMLGIGHQSEKTLLESIDFCAALDVQHISAYILKLEPHTYYYRNADKLFLPDEDTTADLYLFAVEALEQAGFRQYEISNFAKAGFESRHNLKYWQLEEYLGIGAAAHSFFEGSRFYYPRDIDYFLGGGAAIADGTGGSRQEAIMLGLRLAQGISLSLLSESAKAHVPVLIQQGYAVIKENKLALTSKGFLISNTIIQLLES